MTDGIGSTWADAARGGDALARFSAMTRTWFAEAFAAPTPAQAEAWAAIGHGRHVLVVAPTGSGKTLAAFLASLDRLATSPAPDDARRRCRVLYVSPLKALAADVERNLRAPLAGMRRIAARLGLDEPRIEVGIRSGDTPAADRRRFGSRPPDILITTPESLFLLLTSRAREALTGVDTVIVDEVHAVAGTKRGVHLTLSLERLDALLDRPAQRIGLSATIRPAEEVATFLAGGRPVTIIRPPAPKTFDLSVVVPVADLTELGGPPAEVSGESVGATRSRAPAPLRTQLPEELPDSDPRPERGSIWPHVEERIATLIEAHRSTIVFVNSRRLAERLTARLNEIAAARAMSEGHDGPDDGPDGGPDDESDVRPDAGPATWSPAQVMAQAGIAHGTPARLARAHHGSVSKEQRALIEEDLKAGRLPAVVATSSLELGIDMGAVDLVVQVESPPSVASGLQRVGRAGHQVGAVSRGVIFPKYRGDLLQTAVVAERMRLGAIEEIRCPRNPLDVLAQQLVAMVSLDDWDVDGLLALVRRAAPFATLPASAYEAVLDMLTGRYPSDEFAQLRPRLVWDRVAGVLSARPGAQRLAVISGGTIPDRGLFGVFLAGGDATRGGTRVGELDEEMVYESRVGDVFTLGSTSWRIEDITHDRILVSPAPGRAGRLPFWHGDNPGRPSELGRAIGAFVRELGRLGGPEAVRERLMRAGLDEWAADNLHAYLAEQRQATGRVPDDRTIVVERFRDELGDWRVAVHSPLGARVHAPWALAVAARLRERYGVDVQAMHADDGIVLRLPEVEEEPPADLAVFDPEEIEDIVTREVGASALFAARFRECAARALLLPRRDPGRRTPLWQQRQRSAQLLGVTAGYGSFPVVLETMRECLQDVFDVPGLVGLMRDIQARKVRLVEVTTPQPSPFASSLLFGYVAAFMYEGDTPLAERRAAALALDATLLAELLGRAELRDLLSPEVVVRADLELQRLTPERRIRDLEDTADALRLLGPLSTAEAAERGAALRWLTVLEETRRAIRVRIAGEERWVAVEDAGRLRDALGVPLPVGVPEAFTEPVPDPLGDLVSRYARAHGPFTTAQVASRLGLGVAVAAATLNGLAESGRVVSGRFRPEGAVGRPETTGAVAGTAPGVLGGSGVSEREWCDADVLRMLRRRSLAALRKEVEPVPPRALARFLPVWQGIGEGLRGVEGTLRAVEQLQGVAVPASALERLILPLRVAGYSPVMLDELTATGEVLWSGSGALPGADGWITLYLADAAPLLLPPAGDPLDAVSPLQARVLDALADGRALFFRQLADRAGIGAGEDTALLTALWDLVWSGRVTNDTLAPLRALLGSGSGRPTRQVRRSAPARGRFAGSRPIPASVRSSPPTAAGRWSLLPERDEDPLRRGVALAGTLLDRHGVLTRGAVSVEGTPGGFAAMYQVLTAFEESGQARRGYFVEGLGASQFATAGAVDRMRALYGVTLHDQVGHGPVRPDPVGSAGHDLARALVLAATDPANAYGAALPWPDRPGDVASGHKPGRKAGALLVLVDGEPVLYVERGGRTLLSWTEGDDRRLQPAVDALALAVREGALGRLTVERADGQGILRSPLGQALESAGFHPTPHGLRLRSAP